MVSFEDVFDAVRFIKKGPAIMQVKSMEERLANIESREVNR